MPSMVSDASANAATKHICYSATRRVIAAFLAELSNLAPAALPAADTRTYDFMKITPAATP